MLTVGDGIARIYGLEGCHGRRAGGVPHGILGMVLNLEEDNVGVVLFGSDLEHQGRRSGQAHRPHREVPVGEALVGRVVNALGQPIDGKGPIDRHRAPPHRGEGARASSRASR